MKAIRTRYHGPTNTRGARMSATDCDGNTVRMPLDYSHDDNERHAAPRKAAGLVAIGFGLGSMTATGLRFDHA